MSEVKRKMFRESSKEKRPDCREKEVRRPGVLLVYKFIVCTKKFYSWRILKVVIIVCVSIFISYESSHYL